MALAALIGATGQVDGSSDALRATLPLAGRCLVEHQARLAARAGARHIVILVERLPATLMAAIDRLKRDGLGVEIARSIADAADRIHPDEALLVFADGFVTGTTLVERFAAGAGPAILTVPDDPGHAGFERIDATDRWAGLLLIDGARLRATASMIGDWDLESTLLRAAVQEGAARTRPEPDDHVTIAVAPGALAGVDEALVAASRLPARDWPAAWIYPLFERLALPPLLARGVDPVLLAGGGAGIAIVGAGLMAAGWWLSGLIALLLSGPVTAVARRLAAARLTHPRAEQPSRIIRTIAAGLFLVLLAYALAAAQGWGIWPIAALLVLAVAAVEVQRGLVDRLPGGPLTRLLVSLDGMLWAGLPFALFGRWTTGLIVLALYAVLSFFLLQRETANRLPRATPEHA